MPFTFDPAKRFSENLEEFLTELDSLDEDMAKILRDNIGDLSSIVTGGERHSAARSKFNENVGVALDDLLDGEEE